MLGDPLQRLPRQIEPIKVGVVTLQPGDDAQRLRIVVKAAIGRHQRLHRVFASVAERGVAQIMRQRHGLGQIGVQPQHPGNRARHLRHLDGMGQPCAIIIAFMFDKDLCLVL